MKEVRSTLVRPGRQPSARCDTECIRRAGHHAQAHERGDDGNSPRHSAAPDMTGNMTPSYQVADGVVRPVYFYVVDVSEFAVNKLKDRGSLSITGVVTNIQYFIVNAERNLIGRDGK